MTAPPTIELLYCACGAVATPDARYKWIGGDPAHPHDAEGPVAFWATALHQGEDRGAGGGS